MIEFKDENVRQQLLDAVRFNADGLVCAIAQDHQSKEILMVAWMNRESLDETLRKGQVVYYSRSRQALWRKGESSGQTQQLVDIRIDCDRDAVLLGILQTGVACHTGRRSCFSWAPTTTGGWEAVEPVEIDPNTLYGGNT
jgi:phosphoribosyl-AMP cyclohydrolase